jgi:hypothetical protein
MPSALYLYNSRDFAAIDFFRSLHQAFNAVGWDLRSDFNEGLEGSSGNSFERLTTLIGEANAIVYAIGPLGTGKVQGNFEAGQVLQAQQNAAATGRNLNVVPVLIGGAKTDQIPRSMQHLTAQMDNSHVGGTDALGAVFRAVVGGELPAAQEIEHGNRQSTETELQEFCEVVARRAQNKGLTLFVGPYAAADIHGTLPPGDIGRELLLQSLNITAGSRYASDLLTHPWVAATASRLRKPGYQHVWDLLCDIVRKQPPGDEPLPFDLDIAALARAWVKLRSRLPRGKLSWNGLLLVTADQSVRLEKALWKERVEFARLRCSANGRLIYELPVPGAGDPDYAENRILNGRQMRASGTAAEAGPLDLEPILVLKLMDCIGESGPPPLATGHHLRALRDRIRLPDPLPKHLERAPFLMLGGGLLNPLVSLTFAMHFLPYFECWDAAGFDEVSDELDPVPRYIALHSWPGQADAIRRFEKEADAFRPGWPEEVFKLKRIDWPLPDLLSRFTYHIAHR